MVVFIVEKVPAKLRGELSRWMIEPRTGVFVGNVSGMVRDKLWDKLAGGISGGGATMVHSSQGEQGFKVRTAGEPGRSIVDIEGLTLVMVRQDQGPSKTK